MASLIGTAIQENIDDYYVEGVSLTRGGAGRRKQHPIQVLLRSKSLIEKLSYYNTCQAAIC